MYPQQIQSCSCNLICINSVAQIWLITAAIRSFIANSIALAANLSKIHPNLTAQGNLVHVVRVQGRYGISTYTLKKSLSVTTLPPKQHPTCQTLPTLEKTFVPGICHKRDNQRRLWHKLVLNRNPGSRLVRLYLRARAQSDQKEYERTGKVCEQGCPGSPFKCCVPLEPMSEVPQKMSLNDFFSYKIANRHPKRAK